MANPQPLHVLKGLVHNTIQMRKKSNTYLFRSGEGEPSLSLGPSEPACAGLDQGFNLKVEVEV